MFLNPLGWDKYNNKMNINNKSKERNMKKTTLNYAITALACACSFSAFSAENNEIKIQKYKESSTFSSGNIGKISAKPTVKDMKAILSKHSELSFSGNENFDVQRQWVDALGTSHMQLKQSLNGLPVYGTSITIHSTNNNTGLVKANTENKVYAISGIVAKSKPVFNKKSAQTSSASSVEQVKALAENIGTVISEPEKVYIYLPLTDETKLSWKVEVEWSNGGEDFGHDFVFYDVNSLEILTRHAQIHSAKSWKTHTLQNQDQSAAPGQLLCTNNQNCGDASAQRAHDGAAKVYDYYKSRFNRDSINNSGLTMVSSVHLGNNVANAYWTGSQMMYGDGDGQVLDDLTLSFDVIGHELTHGVTQYTAGLIYANASGALNEAWSDIMGVAAKAYRDGTTTADWLLAEESYTPGTSGDAMRYMKNPTQDNYSKDWWPERIAYVSNPNNSNDNGGVHGNSGIANLAFALLTDGGTHPRGKSSAQVPGLGLLKSEQIFYRALTTYMNQNTNFAGARTATAQAAKDLYGETEETAVETAWCAVGVGTCPTSGGGTSSALVNGVAVTNISGAEKAEMFYTLEVPSGATDLVFTTSGGSGDADLYVSYGSQPTLSTYDCNSTTATSSESCTISNVQAGTYHVMVQAWNQVSGVSLTGSYTEDTSGGLTPINTGVDNVSVSASQWTRYTYNLAAGYSDLNISIAGGSGDADLYVNFGSQSTSTNFDCRPWKDGNTESCSFTNPAAGTWYIDVYGYSAASGVTLTLTANP